MSQLTLNIVPRLPYSLNNFILHAGVKDAFENGSHALQEKEFALLWIQGPQRFGKTHLSVCLSDLALQSKRYPQILEGKDFCNWLVTDFPVQSLQAGAVFIVDAAQNYFLSKNPGESGPFVNFIEALRSIKAQVIFLCTHSIDEMPCDDHIKSRLRAGRLFALRNPDDNDMTALVQAMARQRGISLKESRVQFVAKRVRREVPAIEEYLDRVAQLSGALNQSVTRPLLANAL